MAEADLTSRVATIEVGWIIAGRLDDADYQAARMARSAALDCLNQTFSEFSWRMPVIRRPELAREHRVEPGILLQSGESERDVGGLDFGLLITSADLVSHYKPTALAVVSRSLDLAIISTSRIDPESVDENLNREQRIDVMADRIRALALHALGHLSGLTHSDSPQSVMFDPPTVDDLSTMQSFDELQVSMMANTLRQIADLRLEERPASSNFGRGRSAVFFYLHSIWLNWHEIRDAVWQARPWEFPARLSRLSAAALSAALVLIMTAEMWHMALSLSFAEILCLASAALVTTTVFIVRRQQLIVPHRKQRLSEQSVVTNISAAAIVFCGMVTTMALLFIVLLTTGTLLFREALVASWTSSAESQMTVSDYLKLATTAGSLSALIGALGASFEEQHYFRHVTLIDEEV